MLTGVVLTALFVGITSLIVGVYLLEIFTYWIQSIAAGAPIDLPRLVAMRVRRVPLRVIVHGHINATKGGLDLGTKALEAHQLVGGDVLRTVAASIAASKAGLPLTFRELSAIDLAGREPLEVVKEQVLRPAPGE